MKLSAFQNQIAKTISATKSITASSEYGVDILEGSILVLFAKLSSPQRYAKKEVAGTCLLHYPTLFTRFWAEGKCFWLNIIFFATPLLCLRQEQ